MKTPMYNFRLAPEALWFLLTTVAGVFLVDIIGRFLGVDTWPTLDTWQAWLSAAGFAAIRAGAGAALALLTGGGFQKPGEPGPKPPADGGE